jgi:hypothetical protein
MMITGLSKTMIRKWPWAPRSFRQIGGAFLFCIFVAVLLVMGTLVPLFRQSINYGFGSQWDCSDHPQRVNAGAFLVFGLARLRRLICPRSSRPCFSRREFS